MTLIPADAEKLASSELLHNDFETQTQLETSPHLQTQTDSEPPAYTNKMASEGNAHRAMALEEVPYNGVRPRDGNNYFTQNQLISFTEFQLAESRLKAELDKSHLENRRLTTEIQHANSQLAKFRLSRRYVIYALVAESLFLAGMTYLYLNEHKQS